jgi:hypothetical protein
VLTARARRACRAVGEHDDEQPVEALALEVRDDRGRCRSRSRAGGRDLDVGDAGEALAELACVRGLALGDAGSMSS